MKGKVVFIAVLLAVAAVVTAGAAVAASAGKGSSGSGCEGTTAKAGLLSRTRAGEAGGQAVRNQNEESRIRTEHCLEEMNGECSGQCEGAKERLRQRAEDGSCAAGSCEGDCPAAAECPGYGKGAAGEAGSTVNGAGYSHAGSPLGVQGEGKGDCDTERDRLRTRDRECSG